MAAVYAGKHRNGHPVAIKVLHERFRDSSIEKLFRREARIANAVAHPVVVPVIDDDVTEDGCVFLVMPLLHGETVRARAERLGGKLSVEEVAVIGHTILAALGAAHSQRVTHRDLKPENLFVTKDGQVRLLDFGIGRVSAPDESNVTTHAGRVVGTPAFMAPEQALGRATAIDGRTDIWGLGATMFALLSGRLVHEGGTSAETTAFAATRPAPLLGEVEPAVPGSIRDVVDRALRFDPGARWQDAAAMSSALTAACRETFGKAPESLSRLVVPAVTEGAELCGTPTAPMRGGRVNHVPSPDAEASLSFEPTQLATTATAPTNSERRASLREMWNETELRQRRAIAAAAAVVLFLAAGVVFNELRWRASGAAPTLPAVASAPALSPAVTTSIAVAPPPTEASPPRALSLPPAAVRSPPSVSVAAPRKATPSAVAPPRPTATPTPPPKPTATPNCDPPYTVDATGHHVYKVECD